MTSSHDAEEDKPAAPAKPPRDRDEPLLTWQATQLLLVLVLTTIAVLLAAGVVESAEGYAVLVAIVLGALVLILTPALVRDASRRVRKVKVGDWFEAELAEAKEAGATVATPATDEAARDEGDDLVANLVDLRLKLEAKLAYLAKHVLGHEDGPTYVTVGSLHNDGLITKVQARTAVRVMTLDEGLFEKLPPKEQEAFLEHAGAFVTNMRAQVFHAYVRKRLESIAEAVADVDRGAHRRPDFDVELGGRRYRVAAAFSQNPGSKVLDQAKRRLGGSQSQDAQPIVVVPDLRRNAAAEQGERPRVVRLDGLEAALSS